MKICPKCGGKKFIVTAHITEDWIVDENGDYIETFEPCTEVTHYPDNNDVWMCNRCGYETSGSEFEAKEFEVTISYIANKTVKVMVSDADKAVDMATCELNTESPISYLVNDDKGKIVLDGMF